MKIMIRVIAGIVVAGVCSSLSAAGLSAQSYVQDGLVAQFDAIDNVGTGTHDPSATVWKDLRGNATLTLANGASWDADGRWLDNNVKGQTIVGVPGFDLNSVCTECAVNVLSNGSFNGSSSWPRIFFHTSGDGTYSVYFNTAGTAPEAYVNGSGTRPKFGTFRNGTIALASDTTNVRTYNNGRLNESSSLVIAAGVKATAANWTLGGYSGFLRGLYRAFRHYDRALTANEIAWNALVDQLRFFSYEWKGAASGGTWGVSANWKIPSGGEDTPPNACSVRVVGASTTVDRTLILSALSLEDGAALTVPDSIALHADVLLHEGEKVADGVYTGSGNEGTSVAWLSGPGVLTVGAVAASAAVWTGAGGDPKASTVGNWNDPAVRLYDGSLLATFATGGTEALLDNDMVWRGLVFDTAAFAFAESNRRLIVGAGGLLFADAAAARTFSMNVPVELAAAQVWTIGTNTTVNLNKTLTGAGAAVLSVKGAGTLNLSAANHLPGETTFNGNDSNKRLTLNVKDPDALGGPEGSTKVNQMTTALTFTQPGTVRRPISVYCPTNDKDRDVVGPTSGTLVFQEKYTTTQSNSRLAVYGGSTIVFEQPVTTASAWYINKLGSSTAEGRVVCNARLKVGDRLQVPAGVTLELNATTNQINGNSGNVNGTIKCNVPYALWKTTTATSTRGTAVYPYSGTLDLNGYDQAVGILTAKGNTSAGRVTSATPAVLHLVDDYTVDSYDSWVYASDGKTKIAVPGVTNRVAFTGGASLSKEGKYETCLYVASSTTGSLAVVKGDLRMAPVASWRNASAVYVRGGRLVIEKRAVAQGEPFGKKVTDIEVMGGVVDIAEGQVVFCRNLTVNGTTYRMFGYTVGSSQSDAEIKDDIHFSGKGKIKVYGEGPGFMIYLR